MMQSTELHCQNGNPLPFTNGQIDAHPEPETALENLTFEADNAQGVLDKSNDSVDLLLSDSRLLNGVNFGATPMRTPGAKNHLLDMSTYTPFANGQQSVRPESITALDNGKHDAKADELIRTYQENVETLMNDVKALREVNIELLEAAFEPLSVKDEQLGELSQRLIDAERERDNAIRDVQGVEASFAELHGRYEKLKSALEICKNSEETWKGYFEESEAKLRQMESLNEAFKAKAEEMIESFQRQTEQLKGDKEKEMTSLRIQVKRAEMRANGLQSQLEQKTQENLELTKMLDELAN